MISAIVTILSKKRFYEKQRTHQSKKCWYQIIAADSSVCSGCSAAFWEFNIAINAAYGSEQWFRVCSWISKFVPI